MCSQYGDSAFFCILVSLCGKQRGHNTEVICRININIGVQDAHYTESPSGTTCHQVIILLFPQVTTIATLRVSCLLKSESYPNPRDEQIGLRRCWWPSSCYSSSQNSLKVYSGYSAWCWEGASSVHVIICLVKSWTYWHS